MERPTWQDRERWARAEACRWLDRGLLPSPTMVLFEGDDATLYVRSGPRFDHLVLAHDDAQRAAWNELFALGWALTPEAAMVATPIRVRTDADGALAGEAEGEAALGVEWTRRRDDAGVEHGGVVLTYGLDDRGEVVWRDREELPAGDGPLHAPLRAVVTGRWPDLGGGAGGEAADLGMAPAELAYSLRCFGLTVGVARGWASRYRFDVPIPPGRVRREDRRRARAWWDRSRRLAEVSR